MELDFGGEVAPVENRDTNEQQSSTDISDVLQAIEAADPENFTEAPVNQDAMFGNNMMPAAPAAPPVPYCRIKEQPASKKLRFRYECEGRLAGAILGVNSTPEHKTYPAIEVVGYRGRAIVVVSCVTKDPPYKPHPHSLVGKDLCDKGVCTARLNPDTMEVSFSSLGIQCVKKKDIEAALDLREKLRVDPFKTGFKHKSQVQSIDLNAVRLCFQVFLEKNGEFNWPLKPVVSEIIYDKKAMSDLAICRMSHCAASVSGGQDVFLLVEKVAKDDISVVMYETSEDGRHTVWSASADSLHVHRQVAIVFRTPRYHNLQVERPVQAYVQLKRPSDGAVSEPREFELKPITGITSARKRNVLSILAQNKLDPNNNPTKAELASPDSSDISPSGDSCSVNISDSSVVADSTSNGNIGEDFRDSSTSDRSSDRPQPERSLDELLDQVAELDEIYTENRTRLEKASELVSDGRGDADMDDFNDAGTYTSLQLAFKNPVDISDPESYDNVSRGPMVEYSPLKSGEDAAPPLPPKRVRKAPSAETMKMDQESAESLLRPGRPVPLARTPPDLSVSEPALPPPPQRKKRSFLSRLFRRTRRSPPPSAAVDNGRRGRPVGRSVSSVSGQRPSKFKVAVSHTSLKDNASAAGLSYADSITHISLHGDDAPARSCSTNELRRFPGAPPVGEDTILVAETVLALSASDFKKLQDDLDLTEAEHYALYMAVAPHATHSEFDETSCYYSPVDGTSARKRARHHSNEMSSMDYGIPTMDQKAQFESSIKLEPRESTTPYSQVSPVQFNPALYRNAPFTPSPQYAGPTPSPQYAAPTASPQYAAPTASPQYAAPTASPQYAGPAAPSPQRYQYAPAPNNLSPYSPQSGGYSPQPGTSCQWNITMEQNLPPAQEANVLSNLDQHLWSNADAMAAPQEETQVSSGFPSITHLLQSGSLGQLNTSDLEVLLPEISDSFSRMRTENGANPFSDKNY